MDSMDKILRIASGAKPTEAGMSTADKLMQYYTPQTSPKPQDNSVWGRFKNFSESNAGRTLWGGLGTALGVGLTGGSFKDALGYGVIGAGNTVDTLNQNKQYQNQLELKQQERLDAIGKERRENQFKLALQDQALAKSKQLADYQLDKTLERLRGENTINQENEVTQRQRQINAINSNPFLSDEQKQWQIAGLTSGSFDRTAYYTDKLSRNPNAPEALDYFNNQGKLKNIINPPKPLAFGDFAKGAKAITDAGGKAEDLTKFGAANGYNINFEEKVQSTTNERDLKNLTEMYLRRGLSEPEAESLAAAIVYAGKTEAVGGALSAGMYPHNLGSAGYKKYDETRGTNMANREKDTFNAEKQYQTSMANLSNLKGLVAENPGLVGPYAPISAALSRYTRGAYGLNPDELTKRGEIVRNLGSIRNDLIAQAKANGQSGINTAREIEMATAGLNENSSAEEILGALQYMEEAVKNIRDLSVAGNDEFNVQNGGNMATGVLDDPLGIL